jgi:hypothetical protein
MSILSAIGESHSTARPRELAHRQRRKAPRSGGGLIGVEGIIGVEGKGVRVFKRKLGKAHSKPRSHEYLARAADLELPLLRRWQHKIATRSAVAALFVERKPRFLDAGGLVANGIPPRALIRVSIHKGFGLTTVPFAGLLEGAILDRWAGGPNAAQPELYPSATPTYGAKPLMARKACSRATPGRG